MASSLLSSYMVHRIIYRAQTLYDLYETLKYTLICYREQRKQHAEDLLNSNLETKNYNQSVNSIELFNEKDSTSPKKSVQGFYTTITNETTDRK